MTFRSWVTNSERLTTTNELWHHVYEAHISLQASHYHSETTDVALHHYQYFEWSCSTLRNSIWSRLTLLSSVENSLLVICAVKTPRQPVPARCHSGEEWVKIIILIIKIWLTPKQRGVIVHCAFILNLWHLMWVRWKKACVALFVVYICLYTALCSCEYMTACTSP